MFGELNLALSVRDIPAPKIVTSSLAERAERKEAGWMDKCEIVQDSLTAVHRFVAYNAGWLQQALGEDWGTLRRYHLMVGWTDIGQILYFS